MADSHIRPLSIAEAVSRGCEIVVVNGMTIARTPASYYAADIAARERERATRKAGKDRCLNPSFVLRAPARE